ncbi:MAG: hypothetical protein HKN01_09075, partial [Acidimicrobiia bacterium]|nr:hypothetical protein [Acidimicrobiia bacterium]
MRGALTIVRYRGIDVTVDLGLGLFAALMTYAINLDFGNAFPDLSGRIRLGIAVAVVVL